MKDLLLPPTCGCSRLMWIFPVTEFRSDGAPVFLKRYKSKIARIRTSHFKLFTSLVLGFFDGTPKQKGHPSKAVEPRIATTVLVDHGLFVGEREDTSNGHIVLSRDSNLQILAECGNQAAEPRKWWWRQTLPAPRDHQQLIKLLKQLLRGSFLIMQFLALGSPNLSLDTILVKIVKQLLRAFTQVQRV